MINDAYRDLYAAVRERTDAQTLLPCMPDDWHRRSTQSQRMGCRVCPVRELCRAAADTNPLGTWGVWGGRLYPRNEKGRESLRARRDDDVREDQNKDR
jgi:hypothetical protein